MIVSGHVPPGFYERKYIGPFFTNGAGSVANDLFVNLVNKYSDVVSTGDPRILRILRPQGIVLLRKLY